MAQPFLNQCAALRIKPNSSVLEHEAELLQAKVVDLTNNYVGGGGLQALTDILRRNTKLESLILHSNGLSNEAVVFLCRALRGHATLKRIDLSGNPISLPAGLALLQHVHAASGIEDINLDGTLIDELIIRKIQRSININRGSRVARAAPSVVATLASINAEFAEKREVAEKAKRIRAEVAEQLSGSAMRELAAKATLPPRDPESGWLVINVYASTTPGDFCSELELLETDVIPKLNDAFRARKTHFVLTSLYNGLTPKQRAKMPKTCHADVQQALLKAPTVFLQFLGDKVGEFADAVGEQTPLQEFERDSTPAAQRGMRLFLVRQCAKLLKLPAALMPLFSDDPQLVFPDATTSIVRNALLDARGLPRPPAFDPKVAHERYARLLAAKTAIAETPQKFVSLGYTAEFAAVDADGNVRLAKLAALGAGLVRRVSAFVDLLLARANEVSVRDVQRTVDARAALLPGRKSLTGKLDLYCVTPPSRNALLLAHEPGAGATTLLHALNCRLEKRAGFVVASHYVRDPLLSAQSRDAKAMFLSLSQALLTAHAQIVAQAAAAEAERTGVPAAAVAPGAMRSKLKSSVLDDLDVASAKSLFVSTLHDVASDVLAKSIVVVVLIDGVDFIEFPDAACDALRRHEATGADDWPSTDPAAAAATLKAASSASAVGEGAGGASSSLSARAAPSYVDDLDWIPTCLPRTCASCSRATRARARTRRSRCAATTAATSSSCPSSATPTSRRSSASRASSPASTPRPRWISRRSAARRASTARRSTCSSSCRRC